MIFVIKIHLSRIEKYIKNWIDCWHKFCQNVYKINPEIRIQHRITATEKKRQSVKNQLEKFYLYRCFFQY